jgi:hypothetical protein
MFETICSRTRKYDRQIAHGSFGKTKVQQQQPKPFRAKRILKNQGLTGAVGFSLREVSDSAQ